MTDIPEKPKYDPSVNLIPPKKGEIRNPNGRPKGSKNRRTIFKKLLEMAAIPEITKDQQRLFGSNYSPEDISEQLAATAIIKALAGDKAFMDLVYDSGFGKIADKMQHSGSMSIGQVLNEVKSPDLPQVGEPRPAEPQTPEDQCKPPTNTTTTTTKAPPLPLNFKS